VGLAPVDRHLAWGTVFFLSDTSGIAAGLNPQDLQGEVGAAKVPEKWVLGLAIGLLPRNIGAFHGVTLDVYGWFSMKNPMKMDDWGTLILGHLHIFMSKDF